MKQYRCLLLLLSVFLISGQTRVDVEKQGKNSAFLAPPFTKPLRTGASLPSTCASGELYFLEGAPAGGNVHVCHTDNQWAPQGSAGQANLTIQNSETVIGTRPVADYRAGTGIVHMFADNGAAVQIQTSVNTALVATKSWVQSGSPVLCLSTVSTSPGTHECSLSPVLGGYTTGMIVHWMPSVDVESGTLSLDIDHLGAMPVKLSDGIGDPQVGDFRGGWLYALWFDGTRFRVFSKEPLGWISEEEVQRGSSILCVSSGSVGGSYACSLSPELSGLSVGMVLRWIPDAGSDGGATTLAVDGMNAIPVKQSDGITDPRSDQVLPGRQLPIWFDGTVFRFVSDPGDPGWVNASLLQSASWLHCASTSASSSAFACATVPAMPAYTTGMLVHWVPDVSNAAGPITIEVNSLGPKTLKRSDGLSDPMEGELLPGTLYPLWYDGEQFRLISHQPSANYSQTRPTCNLNRRGATWFSPGDPGVKDEFAVCAKDELENYAWRLLY
jgi:hypothetical protein